MTETSTQAPSNDAPSVPAVRIYALFFALIVVWGLSWPISVIGLHHMPPLWFSVARLLIGTVVMFAILLATRRLSLPKAADMPILFSIGILQVALFLILINVGMKYVGASRAAIMAYSTPLWVVPISMFLFNEKISKRKFLGVAFGLLGIFFIFAPGQVDWRYPPHLVGNLCLIGAAFSWALAMVHARYGTWYSSPLVLFPWQLLIALVPTVLLAWWVEPHPVILWESSLVASLVYLGLFATAFGFLGVIFISKNLPPMNTSLWLLGVPVIGVIGSAWMVNEAITPNIIAALISILIGVIFVTLG